MPDKQVHVVIHYLHCLPVLHWIGQSKTVFFELNWFFQRKKGLKLDLETQLHGQHLVADTAIRSISGHFNDPNPQKALVLSMHGCAGCGKNFVSQIIARNLFKKDFQSNFVHLLVATHHFPHKDEVKMYKDNLRQWIKGNVSNCERSMFIFDEMDKMPEGLIDAIQPYIDHYPIVDKLDFRKSIFIFLSNSGSDAITRRTLEHWRKGLEREKLQLKDMEEYLTLSAFNEQGGLWHSTLIEKNLITAFIPFLPMERRHVKKCIQDDIKRKRQQAIDRMQNGPDGKHTFSRRISAMVASLSQPEAVVKSLPPVSEETINNIADSLLYYPDDLKLYAKSGCKTVSQKVDLFLDDMT